MIIIPSFEKTLLKIFLLSNEHASLLHTLHSSSFTGNPFQQYLESRFNSVGIAPRISSYNSNTFFRSLSNPFIYSLCSDVFKGYQDKPRQTIGEFFYHCFEIILKIEKEYPEDFKENFTTQDNCENVLKYFKTYIKYYESDPSNLSNISLAGNIFGAFK